MSNLNSNLSFLQGGGQMGELARAFDWSQTGLGIPEQWPQNLRTAVSILLNSQFPMFVWWGKEQLITIYNDAYKIIAGDKHPSLLGKSGKEGWSEIWDDLTPLVENVFNGNSTWSEDLRLEIFRHGTVEETYFTFSYSPILNDQGFVDGLFCAVVETTEKVFSKRKLEESKDNLAFAIEAAELATWDFNPLNNYFTADARFSELFGISAEEATNNNLALKVIAEEDREKVMKALIRAQEFSSGGIFDLKYTIRPVNLPERILRAKGKSWFNKEKIAYRITGTIQDITDQELSRLKIEESERNLRSIILQAPMAICILKGSQNIIEIANDRMIGLWGAEGREIIGKSIFEVVPEVSKQGFEELLSLVYNTGETYRAYRVPLNTSDNRGGTRSIYIDFVYEAYRESDNKISGIIVVAIDVTEQALSRKLIEESEAELQKRVEERTIELAAANRELKRSNAQLEEFAHAASHDLKEPVRKIHYYTNQLKDQLTNRLTESENRSFTRIENATQRMGNLIDDLLLYSHVSQRPHEMESIDLNVKVQRVLEDLEIDIQEKNATVIVGRLPVIQGYRRQLQQLFQNLISNALKYSRPDVTPEITIKSDVKEINDKVYNVIEVADNGIGFEQQYAQKIFQMFARLHGKNEYSGTGVGLSIVQKVVENHNGMIRAEGEPGKGARFTVYFPVHSN
jgi:PAS domain S-box-containing protein